MAPSSPLERPTYQGANPVSDVWAERALELVGQAFSRVLVDPGDMAARESMVLAATVAGIGFGNAGVHLAHGMSYAVSGLVREYVATGYPPERPLIPHGISVVLGAPAVFRFTAPTNPQRHLLAAKLLGADVAGLKDADAGEALADVLGQLIRKAGVPPNLRSVGYDRSDIDRLVAATLPQRRVLDLSPRPVDHVALRKLFVEALDQ